MLAYDEKHKLQEFEGGREINVCRKCHRLYRQSLYVQIPGERVREYDICPYCSEENGNSMSYGYFNSELNDSELIKLKRKSLIGTVVKYCHEQYQSGGCINCTHEDKCRSECSGNCRRCLEEVHFPVSYPYGKRDYDCVRMLQFYICAYAAKYASEMVYIMRRSEALRQIDDYHVVSVGCGGCPDLMAFETYCHQEENWKSVSYVGIDVNEKWSDIHNVIKKYRTSTLQRAQFLYLDAVTDDYSAISGANVIVLQYVISYFYNTGQIDKIGSFFDKLIEKIIANKQEKEPFVIVINDINSERKGRNRFPIIAEKLKNAGYHVKSAMYYFNYNNNRRYGTMHESNQVLYEMPTDLRIYQPWGKCSSAQLLIEVWEEEENDN